MCCGGSNFGSSFGGASFGGASFGNGGGDICNSLQGFGAGGFGQGGASSLPLCKCFLSGRKSCFING